MHPRNIYLYLTLHHLNTYYFQIITKLLFFPEIFFKQVSVLKTNEYLIFTNKILNKHKNKSDPHYQHCWITLVLALLNILWIHKMLGGLFYVYKGIIKADIVQSQAL